MPRLLLLLSLLAGCGQSGPLYLPGNPSEMTVPPSESSQQAPATDNEDEEETQ